MSQYLFLSDSKHSLCDECPLQTSKPSQKEVEHHLFQAPDQPSKKTNQPNQPKDPAPTNHCTFSQTLTFWQTYSTNQPAAPTSSTLHQPQDPTSAMLPFKASTSVDACSRVSRQPTTSNQQSTRTACWSPLKGDWDPINTHVI